MPGGLFANRTKTRNQGRQHQSKHWSKEQTNAFCDALATGASIAAASILAGKGKGAGSSKLRKIIRALGWQSA